MKPVKLFIASTGKDVGKTTLSLGLIDYLNTTCGPCGFMKPVGQDQLAYQGLSLDKDALLIKEYFKLKETQDLSPVAIPQGFTKDFLDEKISHKSLVDKILKANASLEHYPSCVIEGTGHLGVGSIIDLNNAQVAKLLNTPLILVTKGGLGSSFDELMLNLALCDKYKLQVKGIVLNKVHEEKKGMIDQYFQKALKSLDIPYLGSLPFDLLLAQPTFLDVKNFLKAKLIHGEELGSKHIQTMSIIASNHQIPDIKAYHLVIVSSSREGLIHALIEHARSEKIPLGFILTGSQEPSQWLLDDIRKGSCIAMLSEKASSDVLIELSDFHAKIQIEDRAKIHEAIGLVKKHLDLAQLFQ